MTLKEQNIDNLLENKNFLNNQNYIISRFQKNVSLEMFLWKRFYFIKLFWIVAVILFIIFLYTNIVIFFRGIIYFSYTIASVFIVLILFFILKFLEIIFIGISDNKLKNINTYNFIKKLQVKNNYLTILISPIRYDIVISKEDIKTDYKIDAHSFLFTIFFWFILVVSFAKFCEVRCNHFEYILVIVFLLLLLLFFIIKLSFFVRIFTVLKYCFIKLINKLLLFLNIMKTKNKIIYSIDLIGVSDSIEQIDDKIFKVGKFIFIKKNKKQ